MGESSRPRRKVLVPLILSGALTAAAWGSAPKAGQEGERPPPAPKARVVGEFPFTLISSKPFVQVRVNDSEPLWFILDTGCAGSSTIDWDVAAKLDLEVQGESRVHGGAGEGVRIRTGTAAGVTLEVQGVMVPLQGARVAELGHIEPYEGHRIHGLLGEDFLRRFVVEIDYGSRRIRLFRPDTFEYGGEGWSVPLRFQSGLAVTRTTITPPGKESLECRAVVDTGARVVLILTGPYAEEHALRETQGKLLTGIIGGGAGGVSRGDVGRLERLQWGPYEAKEPVTIFSRDRTGVLAGRGFDGIIGGRLLRRWRVTFDYTRRRMFLEPHLDEPEPFEYDMSGLFLVAKGEGFKRFEVRSVARGSPGDAAGIREGDVIVEINGRPARKFTLDDLRELLCVDGSVCRLGIRRGEAPLEIGLQLRRQI